MMQHYKPWVLYIALKWVITKGNLINEFPYQSLNKDDDLFPLD